MFHPCCYYCPYFNYGWSRAYIQDRDKKICGAPCAYCEGGYCYKEAGHSGSHICNSCGAEWED